MTDIHSSFDGGAGGAGGDPGRDGGADGDASSVSSSVQTVWAKAAEATNKALPSNMGALSDITHGTSIAQV